MFCGLLSIIYLEVTVASILVLRSRLSQIRQRHLGPLNVVKPLEATIMAVLREATLRTTCHHQICSCAHRVYFCQIRAIEQCQLKNFK